jgi:hypothetical protein
MTESADSALTEEVYRPKRVNRFSAGVAVVAAGILLVWMAMGSGIAVRLYCTLASNGWYRACGDTWPEGTWKMLVLVSLPLFAGGIWGLFESLRGLPCLTMTDDRIDLQTVFGTTWANWNSLEKFELKQVNDLTHSASSFVSGEAASKNLLCRRILEIPSAFLIPLPVLITRLNARREQALRATTSELRRNATATVSA